MCARLTIGDLSKFGSIRDRVLQYYMDVLLDTANALNSKHNQYDTSYESPATKNLIDALSHPDLALCPYVNKYIQSRTALQIISTL